VTVDPKMYISVCENPRFRVRVYRSVPRLGPDRGKPGNWIMHVEEKRGGGMWINGTFTTEHEARTAAWDFLESAEIAPDSMTLAELSSVLTGG